MTMKKGIVSLMAVATVMTGTFAASADTLEEALAAAYSSNPQLMAQRAALRATDELVSRNKAGFLPTLSGSYSYSERDTTSPDENGVDLTTPGATESLGLTASQNIFRGFQDKNNVNQAKSNVRSGRAQLQSVEQQILLAAVTAYMNVVRDVATVDLRKNNIQVLERQLQASQDRFRVGEVTRTDVAQSEARLENAKSSLLTAEAGLAGSRANYQRVVGMPAGTLETPTSKPELPINLDAAIELAMELSPGVLSAKHNEAAAKYGVRSAKGALLPTVGVQASWTDSTQSGFSVEANRSFNNPSEVKSIGVQVSVPLYAGGARYSDIRRAKQTHSQRRLDIVQAERVAQENVFVAWDNYRAAVGRIASTQASVRANEIALEGVKQEAYVGSRTTLEVLNAEQELLNARVSLVSAERDEMVAAYNLVSTTGRLTAKDIGLGIDVYDEEEYYHKTGSSKLFGFGTGDEK
jgi:outer membrane protein